MRLPAIVRIGLPAALGLLLGCLAMPDERAGAAGPLPGTVAVGQVLQFSLSVQEADILLLDERGKCSGESGGPLVYSWRVAAPNQLVTPQQGTGENIAFSVTVADSPGFIFPVDVSVYATCGALSAYSANKQFGNFTIASKATPPPPATTATTPKTPKSPAKTASGAAVLRCRVLMGGQKIVVYLRGPATCELAADIAQARVAGWTCIENPFGVPRRYVMCKRAGAWGVALPASGGACAPVTHRGIRYRVFGARVLCGYARATALRMLRREAPYVVESIRTPNAGRWSCRIFGQGANERGACRKLVEQRWIMYFPAGK